MEQRRMRPVWIRSPYWCNRRRRSNKISDRSSIRQPSRSSSNCDLSDSSYDSRCDECEYSSLSCLLPRLYLLLFVDLEVYVRTSARKSTADLTRARSLKSAISGRISTAISEPVSEKRALRRRSILESWNISDIVNDGKICDLRIIQGTVNCNIIK